MPVSSCLAWRLFFAYGRLCRWSSNKNSSPENFLLFIPDFPTQHRLMHCWAKRAVPCGWAAFLFIYFISKMLLNIYGEITSSLEETLEISDSKLWHSLKKGLIYQFLGFQKTIWRDFMLGWLSKASGNDSLSLGKSQKSAPVTATISGPFDVRTHTSLIMGLRGWGNCAVGIVEITQWLAKLQKFSGLYSFKSEHTFWWHCSWSYRYGTISSENARRCKDKADVSVLRPEKIVAKKPLCLEKA